MMMYQKKLLEHFKNTHNRGVVTNPDFSSGKKIPSCGDSISITGSIKDGKIEQVLFEGHGCILSQAAASLLLDLVKAQPIDEVLKISDQQMLDLVGMQLGPNRAQCVLLPLEALKAGLSDA